MLIQPVSEQRFRSAERHGSAASAPKKHTPAWQGGGRVYGRRVLAVAVGAERPTPNDGPTARLQDGPRAAVGQLAWCIVGGCC